MEKSNEIWSKISLLSNKYTTPQQNRHILPRSHQRFVSKNLKYQSEVPVITKKYEKYLRNAINISMGMVFNNLCNNSGV